MTDICLCDFFVCLLSGELLVYLVDYVPSCHPLPPVQTASGSNQQLESGEGGDPPGKWIDLPANCSVPVLRSTR